jgi:hypothetical protein
VGREIICHLPALGTWHLTNFKPFQKCLKIFANSQAQKSKFASYKSPLSPLRICENFHVFPKGLAWGGKSSATCRHLALGTWPNSNPFGMTSKFSQIRKPKSRKSRVISPPFLPCEFAKIFMCSPKVSREAGNHLPPAGTWHLALGQFPTLSETTQNFRKFANGGRPTADKKRRTKTAGGQGNALPQEGWGKPEF